MADNNRTDNDQEHGKQPDSPLDSLRGPAGASTGDPLPIYAWQIRGLLGCINLLEGLTNNGVKFAESWVNELITEHSRLEKIIDGQLSRK